MVDHIVPVDRGSTNAMSNLQTSWRSCNGWKDHPARRKDGADGADPGDGGRLPHIKGDKWCFEAAMLKLSQGFSKRRGGVGLG
jgi:HNH endonuclease